MYKILDIHFFVYIIKSGKVKMTAIIDDYMLSELRTSVAKTGAKFLVCRNGKPMYIDSIKELQDYLKANDLYIYEFELWNNIIHYVFVRGERGGD